jgi:hypothetical protein
MEESHFAIVDALQATVDVLSMKKMSSRVGWYFMVLLKLVVAT